MKKFLSIAIIVVMLISMSSSAFAMQEGKHSHSFDDCKEKVAVMSTVVVDDEGNLIGTYDSTRVSTKSFPCCKEYPIAGLTSVTVYSHVLYDPICYMKKQVALMCDACSYIAIRSDNWKDAGTHNIYTQPGKNYCPY